MIKIALFVIFLLALTVRLYSLGEMPAGFHRDEVISGYVGRFILENGKDIYGNVLPLLYVDKYGDYPPAIPMYFSGLTTYFLGANIFATRVPIALVGALIVFPLYFLSLEIFKDKRMALFTAFIVAILPWHIVLSRATSEGIIALTVSIIGLLFLIKFVKTQKPVLLLVSVLVFTLTYFLYPSYRVLVPLLFLPVPFIFHLKKRAYFIALCALIFFGLLTIMIGSTVWGKGRFEQTSMFGTQSGQVMKQRAQILAEEEGPNKILEVKSYHNKVILYSREFIKQYLTYYSPLYLFIAGGLPYRYSVSDQGLMYLIMIPMYLLLFYYFKDIERRTGILLLYMLFISPMPSPLTLDDVPNVHRTLFMIVPLTLLGSFALFKFLDNIKRPRFRYSMFAVILSVLLIEFIYFLHMYFNHANAVKSIERGDTNKELINYVIQQKANYDQIYMPVHDAFPVYYLFFTQNFDPSIIGMFKKGLMVDKINNIIFTETYCPSKNVDTKQAVLFVDREECEVNLNQYTLIKTFTRHDGTTSYRILTKTGNL